MEPLEQFLNRIMLLLWLGLTGCVTPDKSSTRLINRELVTVKSFAGILYVNNSIFSGTLYSLDSNQTDTLELSPFINGREQGVFKEFYPGRKRKSLRFFNHGKKEGKFEAWWENGNKRLEYNFKNGEYEGNCKEWSSTGGLTKNVNFRNGQEDGLQQQWNASGELWANYEARNGRHYGMTGVKACATLWKNDSVPAH